MPRSSGTTFGFPVVVKADGLAAGKGVVVAADRAEAEAAVRAAMIDRQFGGAGARLVIEECLTGPEVSFFVLADGERAIELGTAQDHKRIGDDDVGPNTGGMGAFAPSPLVAEAMTRDVMRPDRRAGARGVPRRWRSVPRVPLRQPDADRRRAEGDRVQRAARRSGGAGGAAADRGPVRRAAARRRPAATLHVDPRRALSAIAWSASCSRRAAIRRRPESGRDHPWASTGANALPDVLVFHAGTRTRATAGS